MTSCALLLLSLTCGQPAAPKDDAPPATAATSSVAPKPADVKLAVVRLVRQLDDNQLAKREAAEKELAALGPAALEFLPPITRQTSAEVKERLTRVRRELESAAARAATQPALVTLQGTMKLSAALAELEKQTGNKLVDFRARFNQQPRDLEVKADFDKITFWEALDRLLDQVGLTIYDFSGERDALAIVSRSEGELNRAGRATYSGMFRFEGVQVEAIRDLRNAENSGLRLNLNIAWEPRLKPIVITQPLDGMQATDEKGNTLEIDGSEGELEAPVDGETAGTELQIPFTLPSRDVQRIASLKGKLQVLAPGRFETFEFSNLETARNIENRRAAVVVTLEQVRRNQEVHEVRMRVQFDAAANALESHRAWIYNNPAVLVDPKGKVIDNEGLEATLQEANQVGVSYQFILDEDVNLKGYKFVYTTPVAVVKMPVEFELKNIELP